MMTVSSGSIRGAGHVTGSPDGGSSNYAQENMFDFHTLDDLVLSRITDHKSLHKKKKQDLQEGKRVKRKYLGVQKGRTATGKPAHKIVTNISLNIPGRSNV